MAKYDDEGRILRSDFGDLTILNCYFPSGTTGDVRQEFKMVFLEDFFKWAHELQKERSKLIIVGDYNIAHTERDIHDHKGNKNSSGFLPEERAWFDSFLALGFVDTFRHFHPSERDRYTWWSYVERARPINRGWRIDYICVSRGLVPKVKRVEIRDDVEGSDHCPVEMEILV